MEDTLEIFQDLKDWILQEFPIYITGFIYQFMAPVPL